MYALNILKAIFWLVLEPFIVPVMDILTPKTEVHHWPVLDDIYGNRYDRLDGDDSYRQRVKSRFMIRTRWALRNSINNLLRHYGPNGIVESVRLPEYKFNKRVKITRAVINGKKYWFLDITIYKKIHFWLGYALFDDLRPQVNSVLQKGHHFENRMLLPWFKKVK